MCSITDQTRAVARGARLATLIEHGRDITEAVTAELLDPDATAGLPVCRSTRWLRSCVTCSPWPTRPAPWRRC